MKDRIKMVRQELGLSQKDFGDRLGLVKSAISRIENGVVSPSKQTLKFICREFNVDYVWLTEGDGKPFREDEKAIHEMIDLIMAGATPTEKQAFHDLAGLDAKYWVIIRDFFKKIKENY